MRGEKPQMPPVSNIVRGSPPHARGKVVIGILLDYQNRITPACAGKSIWQVLLIQ